MGVQESRGTGRIKSEQARVFPGFGGEDKVSSRAKVATSKGQPV